MNTGLSKEQLAVGPADQAGAVEPVGRKMSRRDFLKLAVISTGGLALTACEIIPTALLSQPEKEIKIILPPTQTPTPQPVITPPNPRERGGIFQSFEGGSVVTTMHGSVAYVIYNDGSWESIKVPDAECIVPKEISTPGPIQRVWCQAREKLGKALDTQRGIYRTFLNEKGEHGYTGFEINQGDEPIYLYDEERID